MQTPDFRDLLTRSGQRTMLERRGQTWPYAQAASMLEQNTHLLRRAPAGCLGLPFRPGAEEIALFLAAVQQGRPLVLLEGETGEEEALRTARRAGANLIWANGSITPLAGSSVARAPEPAGGGIAILTSGTTGEPKIAWHGWEGLTGPVRRSQELEGSRWLLTYPLHLYAGLQVLLHVLLNGGALVVPASRSDPERIVEEILSSRVTCISATPSFWTQLLLFGGAERLRSAPVRQITLGGEACRQALLDRLGDLFPAARLVHIYATTELGRCFSVSDRREGFPASFLQKGTPDGVSIRIQEGELEVKPRYDAEHVVGATEPVGDWRATGDLVEVRGDRVLFMGREEDLINVGGYKVNPLRVERVLEEHELVLKARVYGRASSLVGSVVAADLVCRPDADPDRVRDQVGAFCRQHLHEYEMPRFLTVVPRVDLSTAGKTRRKEG